MLETVLQAGRDASWLPTTQIGLGTGTGTLCSEGIEGLTRHRGLYLPFVANGINWTPFRDLDVLSYNFTGCRMALFTHQGVRKVCHVSTGEGQDCLAEWNRIKAESQNIIEFKPSDFIDTAGFALVGCYGLITSDLQTYAITTTVTRSGKPVVTAIRRAHLLRG